VISRLDNLSADEKTAFLDDLRHAGLTGLADLSALANGHAAGPAWQNPFEAAFDPAGTLPIGVETEYAVLEGGRITTALPANDDYKHLLEAVRLGVGRRASTVHSVSFLKHNSTLNGAFYIDDVGQSWQSVPELLSGFARLHELRPGELAARFDGLELVTPPTADADLLVKAHRAAAESGRFGRGMLSATQFTFNVAHLEGPGGNISQLIDRIIFFENHIKEIYAFINPTRMGAVVNPYAVPLSVNQKGLLGRLAALPYEERTKPGVRAVFQEFEKRELALAGQDSNAAWKYRALGYKKAFGLLGQNDENLLELRISDYASADDLRKIPALLSSIFGPKSSIAGPVAFVDPFPGLGDDPPFWRVSEAVLDASPKAYDSFLQMIGMKPSEYPAFARLGAGPAALRRWRVVERAILDVIPELFPALTGGVEPASSQEGVVRLVTNALAESSVVARRFAALVMFGQNDQRLASLVNSALVDSDPTVVYTARAARRLFRRPG
jgi:hypothetical protein